jgi:hypothetical protein
VASQSRGNLLRSTAPDKFLVTGCAFRSDPKITFIPAPETFPGLCPSINTSLQAPLGGSLVLCPSYRPREPRRVINASSPNHRLWKRTSCFSVRTALRRSRAVLGRRRLIGSTICFDKDSVDGPCINLHDRSSHTGHVSSRRSVDSTRDRSLVEEIRWTRESCETSLSWVGAPPAG